jgi:hypothetical protein
MNGQGNGGFHEIPGQLEHSPGQVSAGYKKWSSMSPQERANEIPAGGKLLGRWHDMTGGTGVIIVESNDLAAVYRWLGRWSSLVDFTLTPVVDDEESAAIGRQIVADNNA